MVEEITLNKDILKHESVVHEKWTVLTQLSSVAESTKQTTMEAVWQIALEMEYLHNNYPDKYPYPISTIFNAIMSDARKKGLSSTMKDHIYAAFRYPDFERFKIHVNDSSKRRKEIDIAKYGQEELFEENRRAVDNIQYFEENDLNPVIQAFTNRLVKDLQKQESKVKRDIEDKEKITIPKPDFLEPDENGRDSETHRSIVTLIHTLTDVNERVWRYPPENPEDDQYYAEGIDMLTALFVPGADLKYVRDVISYLEIILEKETQSIHSAMSKSKIVTDKGKLRKVTREQIADVAPTYILLAIKVLERFPAVARFCDYLLTYQKPHVGDFHINRHPKLSESAFGKSSFLE